jgi:hypothetical protein
LLGGVAEDFQFFGQNLNAAGSHGSFLDCAFDSYAEAFLQQVSFGNQFRGHFLFEYCNLDGAFSVLQDEEADAA